MARFVWVCLGGALGTGARYLLSVWIPRVAGAAFPYATLTVNVAGSFLIGAIMHVGLETEWIPPLARAVLTTGVMGGFTTYSTFSYETVAYFQEGAWWLGLMNIGMTLVLCLGACVLGVTAAKGLVGH